MKCTERDTRMALLESLPRNVLSSLRLSQTSNFDANYWVPNPNVIACSVATIVKRSGVSCILSYFLILLPSDLFNHFLRTSTSQSLKGIITSGALKCGVYAAAKIAKRLK